MTEAEENKRQETDLKNGSGQAETGKNSLPERNEKGQFTNSPGPGRGHKKESFEPLGSDEFKNIIDEGLRSKDSKERAVWARVMLAYNKQIGTSEKDVAMEPFVAKFLGLISHLTENCVVDGVSNGIDVIDRMAEVCINCDRLGTEEHNWFKEVEDDE